MQTSLSTTPSPYSSYRFLQEQGRIHRLGTNWVITRYRDTIEGLNHPHLTAKRVDQLAESLSEKQRTRIKPLLDTLKLWSFFQDASDCEECRHSLSKSLSPKVLNGMKRYFKEISLEATSKLKRLRNKEVDLIREISTPLRTKVLAKLFCCEKTSIGEVVPYANNIFEFIMTPKNTDETGEKAYRGWEVLREFFEKNHDVILKGPFGKELLANADFETQFARFSVVFVGTIFLEKVFGNSMVCFFDNPDEYTKLKHNDHLLKDAVREILRFESPTQVTSRIAVKDFEFCEQKISQGDRVSFLLGAANRDFEVWENADEFMIDREVKYHLALGYGQKICPGGWISSVFLEEALNSILKNNIDFFHLDSEYRWFPSLESRRLVELNVEVR